MGDFATSLLGRKVQFTEGSDMLEKDLPGKKGEIVSAVVGATGGISYHVEVEDGRLVAPHQKHYKLLPREAK
jgi:hypothetical protein